MPNILPGDFSYSRVHGKGYDGDARQLDFQASDSPIPHGSVSVKLTTPYKTYYIEVRLDEMREAMRCLYPDHF